MATVLLFTCVLVPRDAVGAAPPAPVDVNVYVVRSPQQNGGRADTLRTIAARTLGTPDRSGVIFDLNRGRLQDDGAALNSPTDQLHPGWLLRLPADARGPDVRKGRLTGSSAGADQPGRGGVRLPLVLAVVGGVLILELTLALVFRRQLARGLTALREQILALRDRIREPFRRRRALQRHREVSAPWRGDDRALDVASSVFVESTPDGAHAVAVEVQSTLVVAHGAEGTVFPLPWQEGELRTWLRPVDGVGRFNGPPPPVARIGGTEGYQVILDLSWCDGAIAVDGDPALGRELVATLLDQIARRTTVRTAVLGTLDGLRHPAQVLRDVDELEALSHSRSPAPLVGPLRAGAQRRRVCGIVVVSGVDQRDAVDAVRVCSRSDSGWLAVVVGAPVTAHWRWNVHGDGLVDAGPLEKALIAAL